MKVMCICKLHVWSLWKQDYKPDMYTFQTLIYLEQKT